MESMIIKCTNCNALFNHLGGDDAWVCDDCFYGRKEINCTVCHKVVDDFCCPDDGVICHTCLESKV